ncbi:MAG: hypothetical protein M0R68_07590, partial [Bacteroidetes bacterium]|nr:hypothetical protein [Bacteroidota bacterium]
MKHIFNRRENTLFVGYSLPATEAKIKLRTSTKHRGRSFLKIVLQSILVQNKSYKRKTYSFF